MVSMKRTFVLQGVDNCHANLVVHNLVKMQIFYRVIADINTYCARKHHMRCQRASRPVTCFLCLIAPLLFQHCAAADMCCRLIQTKIVCKYDLCNNG